MLSIELKVRDIMVKNAVTAGGDSSLESAIRALHDKHIGSIVITNEEGKCEGIFTARDVLRVVIQRVPLNTPLREVMSKNPLTVREDASYSQAISIVVSHGIRHLPVVDERDRLVGVLSIRSFLDEVVGVAR